MTSQINYGMLILSNNMQRLINEVFEGGFMTQEMITTVYFSEKPGHEMHIQEDPHCWEE